jgi:hypothetical protein
MNTGLTTDIRALSADELDAIAGGASVHAQVKLYGVTLWTFDKTDNEGGLGATSWKGPDGVRHTLWNGAGPAPT